MHSHSFISDECEVSPTAHDTDRKQVGHQREGLSQVGEGRHSHTRAQTAIELEAAIEVCELREIHYEQHGQHVLAEFMRESRAQLEATRRGEQE